jgi:hypothetical protein
MLRKTYSNFDELIQDLRSTDCKHESIFPVFGIDLHGFRCDDCDTEFAVFSKESDGTWYKDTEKVHEIYFEFNKNPYGPLKQGMS